MDKKSFLIGMLSLTGIMLVLGNYFAPNPASGLLTIKDRDFSMVTARTQANGDTLFVLDNRTGRVAVYSYDPAGRVVKPRVFGDMSALFPQN